VRWELLELLDSAGHQEVEEQLDEAPEGWGDMPGYLDIVAENSASAAEIDSC
jgi:hypothetical protein